MSKFRFLGDEITKPWNYNVYRNLIQLEIAYQLKRIADKLEEIHSKNKEKKQ